MLRRKSPNPIIIIIIDKTNIACYSFVCICVIEIVLIQWKNVEESSNKKFNNLALVSKLRYHAYTRYTLYSWIFIVGMLNSSRNLLPLLFEFTLKFAQSFNHKLAKTLHRKFAPVHCVCVHKPYRHNLTHVTKRMTSKKIR